MELKDFDIEDIELTLVKIEESFNIKFVENELDVKNFGELSDAIINKLKIQETQDCTTQQAFYQLREVIKNELGIEQLETRTKLKKVFPKGQRIKRVKKIEKSLGFKLNIIGPPEFVTGILFLLLLGSIIGLFFNWVFGLVGIGIAIVGIWIANKTGTELKNKTIGEVAEKMKRDNYFKSRRNSNSGNKKEIEKTLIEIFALEFDLDKSKLTRETTLT